MSWGVAEFPSEAQYDSTFSTPGITYLAATGDYGTPLWPAVAPNVLAVGGTTLEPSSTPGIYTETGWGNGSTSSYLGGGGGGFSKYEPQPFLPGRRKLRHFHPTGNGRCAETIRRLVGRGSEYR